ncbi:hypothetical protein ACFXPG_41030, partial [Streptomyces sp. NPDC059122]
APPPARGPPHPPPRPPPGGPAPGPARAPAPPPGGEQERGQDPHPLAALFTSADDIGSPPDAPAAGTPAEAYEVVEAELLEDLDSGADGEDVIDVLEVHVPRGMER